MTKIKTIKAGTNEVSWQEYCQEMKDQKPEEYLAGDIEGYRRGFSEGHKKAHRLTLVSYAALVVMFCGGFLIGFVAAAAVATL